MPLDVKAAQEALSEGSPHVSRSRNGLPSSFETYAAALVPGGVEGREPAPKRKLFGLFPSRAVARTGGGGAGMTSMGGSRE